MQNGYMFKLLSMFLLMASQNVLIASIVSASLPGGKTLAALPKANAKQIQQEQVYNLAAQIAQEFNTLVNRYQQNNDRKNFLKSLNEIFTKYPIFGDRNLLDLYVDPIWKSLLEKDFINQLIEQDLLNPYDDGQWQQMLAIRQQGLQDVDLVKIMQDVDPRAVNFIKSYIEVMIAGLDSTYAQSMLPAAAVPEPDDSSSASSQGLTPERSDTDSVDTSSLILPSPKPKEPKKKPKPTELQPKSPELVTLNPEQRLNFDNESELPEPPAQEKSPAEVKPAVIPVAKIDQTPQLQEQFLKLFNQYKFSILNQLEGRPKGSEKVDLGSYLPNDLKSLTDKNEIADFCQQYMQTYFDSMLGNKVQIWTNPFAVKRGLNLAKEVFSKRKEAVGKAVNTAHRVYQAQQRLSPKKP